MTLVRMARSAPPAQRLFELTPRTTLVTCSDIVGARVQIGIVSRKGADRSAEVAMASGVPTTTWRLLGRVGP